MDGYSPRSSGRRVRIGRYSGRNRSVVPASKNFLAVSLYVQTLLFVQKYSRLPKGRGGLGRRAKSSLSAGKSTKTSIS